MSLDTRFQFRAGQALGFSLWETLGTLSPSPKTELPPDTQQLPSTNPSGPPQSATDLCSTTPTVPAKSKRDQC